MRDIEWISMALGGGRQFLELTILEIINECPDVETDLPFACLHPFCVFCAPFTCLPVHASCSHLIAIVVSLLIAVNT